MTFKPDEIRLQHLQGQLQTQLNLLNDTERQMQVAPTPQIKENLRMNAEQTREFYDKTLKEYNEIKAKGGPDASPQMQTVADQLQSMDAKLTAIRSGLGELQQAILARFDQSEQSLIGALLTRLSGEHLANTQAILGVIEAASQPQTEQSEALALATQGIAALEQQAAAANKPLPPALEKAARVVEDPKLEFKHRLKVAIPLIPGILTYERELGFNVNLNVQAAYDRLKRLIPRRADPPNPS